MRAIFASLTSAHALLLLLSLVSLAGVLVGVTLVQGWVAQAVVVAVSVLVLLLGARTATPSEWQRQATIRYAVYVFAGVLALITAGRPLIDSLLPSALQTWAPAFAATVKTQYPDVPIFLTLAVVFLMYAVTLLALGGQAPLGRIARDPHLREPSYRERRATFAKILESHLGRVDDELRWHHRHFVELRAEVDVRNGNRVGR